MISISKTRKCIAACLIAAFGMMLIGCESKDEFIKRERDKAINARKASMFPFEEIKLLNTRDGCCYEYYSLVCDRSTGVIYLQYATGRGVVGLTVYLDETLKPARCEKITGSTSNF